MLVQQIRRFRESRQPFWAFSSLLIDWMLKEAVRLLHRKRWTKHRAQAISVLPPLRSLYISFPLYFLYHRYSCLLYWPSKKRAHLKCFFEQSWPLLVNLQLAWARHIWNHRQFFWFFSSEARLEATFTKHKILNSSCFFLRHFQSRLLDGDHVLRSS